MMKIYPYIAILAAICCLTFACQEPAAPAPPNIVLIVADDLGWHDLHCYGNDFIETPNLDQLASEGLRFTNGYAAAPLCSPTRASIVTGQNPARINMTEHLRGIPPVLPSQKIIPPRIERHLPLELQTTAELLKGKNYLTAHIGKWHLGGGDASPQFQGYDHVYGGSWAALPGSFFYPFWGGDAYPELKADSKEGDYLTDKLTDEALRFLETNQDTSFFLALNFYAPHVPIEAKEDLVEKYRAKRNGAPDSLLPDVHYAAMVDAIDQNVGRIMQQIKQLKLDQKTLIVFTSDNGGLHVRSVPAFAKHTPPTDNGPLRAGKGYIYEGGIREPFIFHGPKAWVKPGESEVPISTDDLFNTFAALTGASERSPDGKNLLPLLQGGELETRAICWHFPHYSPQGGMPGAVIRDGDYKLIEWYETGELELFNLKNDMSETRNLASEMPQVADSLQQKLHNWRTEVGANMPTENPDYQPNSAE